MENCEQCKIKFNNQFRCILNLGDEDRQLCFSCYDNAMKEERGDLKAELNKALKQLARYKKKAK